jgi:hypothetical protein
MASGPSGPRAQRAPTRSGGGAKPPGAGSASRAWFMQPGRGRRGGRCDPLFLKASRRFEDMKAILGNGLETLRGKLGPLCGKVIRGQQQIGRLSVPYSLSQGQPSSGQLDSREFYREKIKEWQGASAEDRENWNAAAEPLNISGFNYLLTLMGAKWNSYEPLPIIDTSGDFSYYSVGSFLELDAITFVTAYLSLSAIDELSFLGMTLPSILPSDSENVYPIIGIAKYIEELSFDAVWGASYADDDELHILQPVDLPQDGMAILTTNMFYRNDPL